MAKTDQATLSRRVNSYERKLACISKLRAYVDKGETVNFRKVATSPYLISITPLC